jgi:hypothetical protein
MIYIVIHGEYENTEITLVTENIDKAINHWLNYRSDFGYMNIKHSIEIWHNDKAVCIYGNLLSHLINKKKDITFEELKNDIMKYAGLYTIRGEWK